MALDRVALGQVHFNVPGLTPDARGVVGGRQIAVRLLAMDRLVSLLRLLSATQSVDDVLNGLRIVHVRARVAGGSGTRETVLFLPGVSTRFLDTVARLARIAGGHAFTGSGKHFVQVRDARSPLGYDAPSLSQDSADLILYGQESTTSYLTESELALDRLLLRLQLRRLHGGRRATLDDAGGAEVLYLTARRGLGTTIAQYLQRSGVGGGAALCETTAAGAFRVGTSFWLFRLDAPPARLLPLFATTPGLALYRLVTPTVAVAAGYRHPVHLEACRTVFPADRLYLLGPGAAGVTLVAPAPTFVAIDDLVRLPSPLGAEGPEPEAAHPETPLAVDLRLEAAPAASLRPVAALVPWPQVPWLRRLCSGLPTSTLRQHRVALLGRGVLVIGAGAVDALPFGALLVEAGPGVLVPLGTRLRPAVSPDLLAQRLGATGGTVVLFTAPGQPPVRVDATRIAPLEREVLAELALAEAPPAEDVSAPSPPRPIEIFNETLGPMPLWGVES